MIQFKGQLASRYNSKSKTFWRTNQNIQAANLRVIGSDGKQVGVLSRDEALQKAKEAELDLVEIAASANPPVRQPNSTARVAGVRPGPGQRKLRGQQPESIRVLRQSPRRESALHGGRQSMGDVARSCTPWTAGAGVW